MFMSLISIRSLFRRVASTHPSPSLYVTAWTVLLIATVLLTSLIPCAAYMFAMSSSSSFSKPCRDSGFVRIPLDFPRETACLPAQVVKTSSRIDFFLPTLFAAMVVGASTCVLRAVVPWESFNVD